MGCLPCLFLSVIYGFLGLLLSLGTIFGTKYRRKIAQWMRGIVNRK